MKKQTDGFIAVCGGSNYDIHSKIKYETVFADSNPASVRSSSGGVGRNIAENLSLLGENVVLLSAVGSDPFGKLLLEECDASGIDASEVFISSVKPTSVYLDILDSAGNLIIGVNDMEILNHIPENYFESKSHIISSAKAVVIDANLIARDIEYICNTASDAGVPVFADPVSTAKCLRLDNVLDKLEFIKPNLIELEKMSGLTGLSAELTEVCTGGLYEYPGDCSGHSESFYEKLYDAGLEMIARGVRTVCASMGDKGAFFMSRNGLNFILPSEHAEAVNATGAGDAFMAGYVHAFCCGRSPKESVSFAMKCGALAVSSPDTINSNLAELKQN